MQNAKAADTKMYYTNVKPSDSRPSQHSRTGSKGEKRKEEKRQTQSHEERANDNLALLPSVEPQPTIQLQIARSPSAKTVV